MPNNTWQRVCVVVFFLLCVPFLIGIAGYGYLGYLAVDRLDIVMSLRYLGLGTIALGFFTGVVFSYRVLTVVDTDHRLLAFSYVLLGTSLILVGTIVESQVASWKPGIMIPLIIIFVLSRIMAHRLHNKINQRNQHNN